jgi:hypothetical protein
MTQRSFHLALLSSPFLFFVGCSPDSPLALAFSPPSCSIVGVQKIDASFPDFAKIRMTVKNTGDATAYNVACGIKLKTGSHIVDESAIYFGTLASGESYAQEAWFSNIQTHSQYSNAEYHLYWYDAEGTYHE